ncbi:N-acetyltransferase, partial [Enterococcus faecium]
IPPAIFFYYSTLFDSRFKTLQQNRAKHKNLHGLMLETQDNNLIACKFYHNCGFKIGSVDTMLYANFENNFEKAVFWYLRF